MCEEEEDKMLLIGPAPASTDEMFTAKTTTIKLINRFHLLFKDFEVQEEERPLGVLPQSAVCKP
eukprot:m.18328 g.18328  ORF g.18328 m.18328 type:complete len:64 (+) comp8294_c0_seq2:67-258(+)